jgi:hypothetical protein
MSILTPCEIDFANLAGTMNANSLQYVSKELASERLEAMTEQDFGFDVDRSAGGHCSSGGLAGIRRYRTASPSSPQRR